MNLPTRTTCYVVILTLLWSLLNPVWAQSDDDDTVGATITPSAKKGDDLSKPALRIGVLDVRPTFEAEHNLTDMEKGKVNRFIQKESQQINLGNTQVVPQSTIMKYLGIREKAIFQKCWIDPACLSVSLKPAKLDLLVASKLRMQQVGAVGTTKLNEYTVFIRIIDLKDRRIIREVLVTKTDLEDLLDSSSKSYAQTLIDLGLVVASPIDRPAGKVQADDVDSIYQAPKRKRPVRNLGLKIGAYTTLGLAVASAASGLAMGVLSNNARDDANNAQTIADMEDKDSTRKTYMITSNALYGVAGAFAITSIVLFVLGYQNTGSDEFAATGGFSITPDGAFVQAQTRF